MIQDSPYGFTRGLNGANAYLSSTVVSWAVAMGLSWCRIQLDAQLVWKNQSDPASLWSWNQLDDAVSQLNAAGLHVSYPLRGMPAWAFSNSAQQASTEPYFAPDPSTVKAYAQAVAQRYNGLQDCISNGHNYGKLTIQAIEVGNEEYDSHDTPGYPTGTSTPIYASTGASPLWTTPNTYFQATYPNYVQSGVNPKPQPARDPHYHLPVVKACAPVIRDNCEAAVIGCAIYDVHPINYQQFPIGLYTDSVYGSIKGYVDALNIHFYTAAVDPSVGNGVNTATFPQAWGGVKSARDAAGDSVPIWITEIGWGSNQVSQAQAATNFTYCLNSSLASGCVEKFFFFTLDDAKVNPSPNTLMLWNGTSYQPTAAYTAYTNFMQSNPQWITSPWTNITLVGRDGLVGTLQGRDGLLTLQGRGG